ncbi:MAG TPA: amidohydrolase family protein [Pyrinomonadaceae bacterium]|nr:amidohydrolase family protein [Pyrinomonadaceae bacterium]
MIDLQGKTVIPGINDAHFHFTPFPEGIQLTFNSMEPTWAETVEAIKKALKTAPKGKWIFGTIGYNALSEKTADRFALDQISPDNPILLGAFYGHGDIFNSKAMPLLKIADDGPDVLGGYFERVSNSRKVNGRSWEYAQWRPARVLADQASDEIAIAELKKMSDEAVRFGVTSMQVMSTLSIDRFAKLLVKADLPIRVRAIPFALTFENRRDLSEFQMLSKLNFTKSKVKASGIKWILDGTPFEHGSATRQPYTDMPSSKGKMNFPEAEISKMLKESLNFNQQILFHCSGDRCVESVFDAMEKIKIDWKQKRVRIEHGDGVSGDLIERGRKLGVIVVQNPTHLSFVEMLYSRYSPKTAFMQARSLIDGGMHFALGSDGPMNPYLNIMFSSIHPSRPTEAITREQAVVAYTKVAAFAEFTEKDKGSLIRGKLADLSVLSQDIFTAPVPELPKTHSILTFIGGKIAYDEKLLK